MRPRTGLLIALALLGLAGHALAPSWTPRAPGSQRSVGSAPSTGPTLEGARRRPRPGDAPGRAAPASGEGAARGAAAEPGEAAPASPDEQAECLLGGRVLTADGQPLSGARVRLLHERRPDHEPPARAAVTTGQDGRFRLEATDARLVLTGLVEPLRRAGPERFLLLVQAEGHGPAWRVVPGPGAGAAIDVGDVPLGRPTGSIAGRVVGAAGEPLSARVQLEREDLPEQEGGVPAAVVAEHVRGLVTRTDPRTGSFRTAPLWPGRYRLMLQVERAGEVVGSSVHEHVAAGTTGLGVVLPHVRAAPPPAPFPVRVRVRHEAFEGAPALPPEGAAGFSLDGVALDAERAGPDGLWLVQGVVSGEEPLLVNPGAGPWAPAVLADLRPDGGERAVRLPRARVLRGVVRLDGRGVPARVQWSLALSATGAGPHPAGGTPPGQRRLGESGYTDAEGRFRFEGLPAGTLSVWADPVHDDVWYGTSVPADQAAGARPPFHPSGWRDVALDPEREVVLEVERLRTVVLRLAWPDGEPRPQAEPAAVVRAWQHREDAWGQQIPVAATSWDGALLVVHLHQPASAPPIDVLLRAADTWALLRTVPAGEEPPPVALTACARIEGRVLGPDGEPVEGVIVWARPAAPTGPALDRYAPSARSDASGRFLLRPTGQGTYLLLGDAPGEGLFPLPARARTGAEPALLRLATARWLVGRVVVPGDGPPPEAWVSACLPDPDAVEGEAARCTDDGFFRLRVPADRPVLLRARDAEERLLGESTVEIGGPVGDLRLPVRDLR